MGSRALFHKYLTELDYHKLIDPGQLHIETKLLGTVFIVGLLVLLTFFNAAKRKLIKEIGNRNITKRMVELSRDLFFLLLCVSILRIIDYLEIIADSESMMLLNDIALLVSVFSIVYVAMNFFSVFYFQWQIGEWLECEKCIPQRVRIYRKFEKMYITASGEKELLGDIKEQQKTIQQLEKDKEYEGMKKQIQFIVLRQEFLSPTFLPTLREAVFRDDFRFAIYLGKCLYKTAREALSIRFVTLLSFILFLIAYGVIVCVLPESFEIIAMTSISILFFFLQFALKVKSANVYASLSNPLRSPYEFQVAPFDAVRNPASNIDRIFVPKYLRDAFEGIKVTSRRIVNAHEALFWFSSPVFCLRLLHFCIVSQIIWMIVLLTNYHKELTNLMNFGIAGIGCLIVMLNLVILFPITIRNLTIVSNVYLSLTLDRDAQGSEDHLRGC